MGTRRATTPSGTGFSAVLRVRDGFRLQDVDPRATPAFTGGKKQGRKALVDADAELADLQERLYATGFSGGTARVLLIIQGLDTAGKGGIMRHVVGAVDPQGTQITAFKAPTPEELDHPFLWRIRKALPPAGIIGVFDRSHYEDVLVPPVQGQAEPEVWRRRYRTINNFERSLVADGTTVIKVMLQISHREQGERLAERLQRPDKYWKYDPGDIDTRLRWDDYQLAYQELLVRTSTSAAPWFVVPADRKWYARLAVQQVLREHLVALDLQWPPAHFDLDTERRRLAETAR